MLPYFPFGDEFDIRMGTVPLRESETLFEVDAHYHSEITHKRALLKRDHRYYFQARPDTELAQWDVLERALTELAGRYPQHFSLQRTDNVWFWNNRLTGEQQRFIFGDADTLPLAPLDWVGRQVQEDVVILSADGTASVIAGQLCFPNGWCLDDKFGQTFLGIHRPAPAVAQPTFQAAQKLLERIPAHRPVWRASWNFKTTNQLDMSTQYSASYNADLTRLAPTLTADTIGDQVFIRIERQTLTRMPRSGTILFGIHTYQNSLAAEARDSDRARRMLAVLRTTPREMLDYKGVTPFEDALLNFLERRASASVQPQPVA